MCFFELTIISEVLKQVSLYMVKIKEAFYSFSWRYKISNG